MNCEKELKFIIFTQNKYYSSALVPVYPILMLCRIWSEFCREIGQKFIKMPINSLIQSDIKNNEVTIKVLPRDCFIVVLLKFDGSIRIIQCMQSSVEVNICSIIVYEAK